MSAIFQGYSPFNLDDMDEQLAAIKARLPECLSIRYFAHSDPPAVRAIMWSHRARRKAMILFYIDDEDVLNYPAVIAKAVHQEFYFFLDAELGHNRPQRRPRRQHAQRRHNRTKR